MSQSHTVAIRHSDGCNNAGIRKEAWLYAYVAHTVDSFPVVIFAQTHTRTQHTTQSQDPDTNLLPSISC